MKIYRVVSYLTKDVIQEFECDRISEKSVFFKDGLRIAKISLFQSFFEDYESALEYAIESTKDKIDKKKTEIASAEKMIEELTMSLNLLENKK